MVFNNLESKTILYKLEGKENRINSNGRDKFKQPRF